MSKVTAQLLDTALTLSTTERAELAAELLASLDGEGDPGVERAWAAEIERRAAMVRSGQATGRPWSEVYGDLRRSRG